MNEDYELVEMSVEEGQALTNELQEVLKKYDAEMGVSSRIQLLKRVPIEKQSTPSPYTLDEKGESEPGKETTEA